MHEQLTCDVCNRRYDIAEGCDCHEYLDDHAEQCAFEAVRNGLWNGFDEGMGLSRLEWIRGEDPRIEDKRDLIDQYGRKTATEMRHWVRRWREACCELYVFERILHPQERMKARLDCADLDALF